MTMDDGGENGGPDAALQVSLEEVQASALESLRELVKQQGGSLPDGYSAGAKVRQAGASQGSVDTYFYSADGERFRSKFEVLRHLGLPTRPLAKAKKEPSTAGKATIAEEKLPQTDRKRPRTAKKQPPTEKKQRTVVKTQPSTEEKKPSTAKKRPPRAKQQPPTAEKEANASQKKSPASDSTTTTNPASRSTVKTKAATQLLQRLEDYIKEAGGNLVKGWRVDVRFRNSGSRAGTTDAHYVSPDGRTYRSRLAVARALGLVEGPASGSDDADMPDHDVAALLMELYQEAQQEASKRKKHKKPNGVVTEPMTPTHRTPPAGSGPPDTSNLNTMAEALSQISPNQPSPLSAPQLNAGRQSVRKGARAQQEKGGPPSPSGAAAVVTPTVLPESNNKRPLREKARNQINFAVLETAAKQEYVHQQEAEKKRVDGEAELREARKARKQAAKDNCGSNFSKLLGRVRGQISRIRHYEHKIDVYGADGWKGSNREKLKPTGEIQNARMQLEKSRENIREAVKFCEDSEGDKPIPQELFDEDGEIEEENICCSRCGLPDSEDGNDIVLCDGNCNRAYHEKCVVPPVNAAELEEDEGWLCPGCDTKVDILNLLNEEFGTEYELATPWHDVLAHQLGPLDFDVPTTQFAGPAGLGSGVYADLLHGQEWPESDPEDSDFRDDASEHSEGGVDVGLPQPESSGGASSGDGDGEEGTSSQDDEVDEGDNLDLRDEIDESVEVVGRRTRGRVASSAMVEHAEANSPKETQKGLDAEAVVLTGKRKRKAVDYQLLNAVMFGDGDYIVDEASDEDFAVNDTDLQRMNSG